MAGRVHSEARLAVMTVVHTTGLRDKGFDGDLLGRREDIQRIGLPSAAATRRAETCMRAGWLA
jgi:hypothetical protein